MVQINIGHSSHDRQQHVGAIQSAAHAHFDDSDIDRKVPKVHKGHPHTHLEEAQFQGLKRGFPALDKVHDKIFRAGLAIEPNALPIIDQMRRRVQAHPVARLLQAAGHHVRGGTFAIGAPDMYGLEAPLRMPQGLHEGPGFG